MAFEMASCGNGGGTGSTGCDRRRLAEPPNGSGGTDDAGLQVTGSGGFGGRLRVTPGGGISGIVRTSNATMRVCASLTRSFAAPSRALASSFSRSRWARSCVRWLARVSSSSLSRSDSSSACLRRSRSLAAMASVLWANPRRTPWKAVDGGVSGVSRGGFAASKIYRLSAARSVPTKNVHHITQQRAKPRDVTVCQ